MKLVNSFLTEGASRQLLHCHLLPELQQKQEFLLQQGSWRATRIRKENLWSNIKGENIEPQTKIKIFISFYFQLRRLRIHHPFVPHQRRHPNRNPIALWKYDAF